MKTDSQLKNDITTEIEWDPAIHANRIGVAVDQGIVTLTGHLDTFAEKFAVEKAVARVQGVKSIAVELDVKLEPGHKRSDSEIAAAAETALKWHSQVPDDRVQVRVEKGWITLKGEVDWDYQRQSAEVAVRLLTGVVGVSNGITLKVFAVPANVATRIRDAFKRYAENEANRIDIEVQGPVVTLRGKVDSLAQRNAAFGAAWSAPGISRVVNEITVQP